ncbi:MAG TPA: hypothetical protein VM009_05355 [Terriglobales bacterium]|nr:hypothetical protein [Terriglobales bacterium]
MRYTSLLEPMFLQPIRRRAAALSVLLCFAILAHAQATNDEDQDPVWTKPAHDLVKEALDKAASPATVSYDVENRAGLSPAAFQQVRRAIDNEFRAAKVKIVRMESAIAEMKFILSRNPRGLLWIARVKQGTTEQLSMVEFPDPLSGNAGAGSTMFRLERTLLLSRTAPMLDVAIGNDFLLVLGSEQISLYPRNDPTAMPMASAMVLHSGAWPRDLRGRIFLTGDTFAAYLPGMRCSGAVRPQLTAQCSESDDPWPMLGPTLASGENGPAAFLSGARNHFSGVLGGSFAGMTVPAFFASARLGESAAALWALSGTDGLTRLYIRMGQQPSRTVTSLGSDLAAVRSNCGGRWQLLVSGDGDETMPDVLQAFEIKNRDASAVSEKLTFDGPITALWSSADASQVVAVVRNLGKENHEAYSLAIDCSH